MNSYSETAIFPGWAIQAFERAQVIVERLRDHDDEGRLLRCHEVARIVRLELLEGSLVPPTVEVLVCDGLYSYVEHSWLVMKERERELDPDPIVGGYTHGYGPAYILDPYAVGRLPQVQLLIPAVHHGTLYEIGKDRDDIRQDVIDREREVVRAKDPGFFNAIARIM